MDFGMLRKVRTSIRDIRVPLLLLVVVIVAQQCSGMKIIQGYAVEIFADTFSHARVGGLQHGREVDTVAYWSAVIMGGVRLGQSELRGSIMSIFFFQLQIFH